MGLPFDDIDAHKTGGWAERIAESLNVGMSESVVAKVYGRPLHQVHYIAAHEGYGVKPKTMRVFEFLALCARARENRKMEKEFQAARRVMRQIRKAVTDAGRSGM